MTDQPYYTGNTRKPAERWRDLPVLNPDDQHAPAGYLASKNLQAAVNVALELGLPLLLTGEPGCGKSRLAHSLAWQLGFPGGEPLVFTVKSDTEARELFYRFDTLGRFHAANLREQDMDPRRFVSYNALGQAILRAKGRAAIPDMLMLDKDKENYPEEPCRSVVLIDEIDKAPREIPNDILSEIENMAFEAPELFHGQRVGLAKEEQRNRPVVVITSNSERELPPAFLRRCVFFHLELPPFQFQAGPGEVSVEAIVEQRLGTPFARSKLSAEALSLFRHLREHYEHGLHKPPSLAELLDWLRFLSCKPPAPGGGLDENHPQIQASLGLLLKSRDECNCVKDLLADWRAKHTAKS